MASDMGMGRVHATGLADRRTRATTQAALLAPAIPPSAATFTADDVASVSAGPTMAQRLLRPVAALLSLVIPGVGQVAIGHPLRGLRWYAATALGWTLALIAASNGLPRAMWWAMAAAVALHFAAAVDGFQAARMPRPLGPTWLDSAAALVAGFLLAALPVAGLAQARAQFVMTFPIQTPSMYPTLEVGDRVLVEKRVDGNDVSRGDLLVFRYPRNPATTYVKRVIGVGGDTIEVRGDAIIVNGQAIVRTGSDEPCRAEGPEGATACAMWNETLDGHQYRVAERAPDTAATTVLVPPGHYFVVGDNRDGSNDSRLFGTVPSSQVLGRATFVAWSVHAAGVRWDRISRGLH